MYTLPSADGGGPMANSFGAFPNLLSKEYFYEHSEPHRRRPTVFEFPAITTHTATYFSLGGPAAFSEHDGADHRAKFREILGRFVGWYEWTRRPVTRKLRQLDVSFIDKFCAFVESNATGAPSDSDEVLAFECMPHANARLAARVEVHKEYFSMTFFYGFDAEHIAGGRVRVRAPDMSPLLAEKTFETASDGIHTGLLDIVFGPIHERLLAYLNSAPLNIFAELERLFPRCTFASAGCRV